MSESSPPGALRPPLQRLLIAGVVVCPDCLTAALTPVGDALVCGSCGAVAPVNGGVPDFFNNYDSRGIGGADPYAPFVGELIETLALEDSSLNRQRIASAIARTGQETADSALTAEIRDLRGRFVPAEMLHPETPPTANTCPEVSIERHYAPAAIQARRSRTVNVRLLNTGESTWSSRIDPRVTVASRFVRRGATAWEHTALPVDIVGGRAITLPVRVQPPRLPGRYRLEVCLHHAVDGVVAGDMMAVDIDVRLARPAGSAGSDVIEHRPQQLDYAADHVVAVGLVDEALNRARPTGARTILEIGGGVHPQSSNHDRSSLVNLDISSPMLELGVLVDERHGREIAHVCADALRPPLSRGTFDLVAMYATLHHFAEPEVLLRTARRLIHPSGLVAVMCEPVSDSLAYDETVIDLLKGINEQTFLIEEYLWMFEAAGLTPEVVRVDAGSLKAILRVT